MTKKKKIAAPKRINQKRLVKVFKDIKAMQSEDNRFCFLIGAGASKSSGIQTGWELSKEWHKELQEDLEVEELEKWEQEIDFDADKVGEFYSHLYKKRYESCHQVGYDKFKRIMESAEPGLGYVILARMLAEEKHNFVITTNFDYLIEDAIRMYTSTKPFTAGHEIMAQFISSQTERPTIIKVHRDLLLNPFNDEEETKKLKEEWGNALLPIVKNFGLLVIGYGGNDGSLMDYLTEIDVRDRKPIYWCVRNENDLNDRVLGLLSSKDYIVNIEGFDELMYKFDSAMNYKTFKDLEDIENHQLVISAKKRVQDLEEKRKELFDKTQKEKPEDISEEIKEIFTDAEKYILQAAYEEDSDNKEAIYKEGIKKFPKNLGLLNDYALFLNGTRNGYDEAEKYFKLAMSIESDDTDVLGNYAHHLILSKQDFKTANVYIEKSFKYIKEYELGLLSELWFYRYAHYPEWFVEAEKELEELIAKGIKSIGWNFEDHIKIAKENGHPNLKKLQEFADAISKE